jgi:hypothetical protein
MAFVRVLGKGGNMVDFKHGDTVTLTSGDVVLTGIFVDQDAYSTEVRLAPGVAANSFGKYDWKVALVKPDLQTYMVSAPIGTIILADPDLVGSQWIKDSNYEWVSLRTGAVYNERLSNAWVTDNTKYEVIREGKDLS